MRHQTMLLNGEPATIEVPRAKLLAPVRTSVLIAGDDEVEVNAGRPAAADFFAESTETRLSRELTLLGGRSVRVGRLGGDPASGWAFRVDVGDDVLFGAAPAAMSLEAVVGLLSSAGIGRRERGLYLRPSGPVSWSPYRTHDLAQTAEPTGGAAFLLDVRRAHGPSGKRGARVRGGWLSRSQAGDRVHVVLEAPEFVVYGIPPGETGLDAVVRALADTTVSLK